LQAQAELRPVARRMGSPAAWRRKKVPSKSDSCGA
jgi:hypothetical protein